MQFINVEKDNFKFERYTMGKRIKKILIIGWYVLAHVIALYIFMILQQNLLFCEKNTVEIRADEIYILLVLAIIFVYIEYRLKNKNLIKIFFAIILGIIVSFLGYILLADVIILASKNILIGILFGIIFAFIILGCIIYFYEVILLFCKGLRDGLKEH